MVLAARTHLAYPGEESPDCGTRAVSDDSPELLPSKFCFVVLGLVPSHRFHPFLPRFHCCFFCFLVRPFLRSAHALSAKL